jgi:hypothetical protein
MFFFTGLKPVVPPELLLGKIKRVPAIIASHIMPYENYLK